MNPVYAFLYMFLGSTPDGVDHYRAYSIGPDDTAHCRIVIEAAMRDDVLGEVLTSKKSVSGCLSEKTMRDFLESKGCLVDGPKTKMPDGAFELSYKCDTKGA